LYESTHPKWRPPFDWLGCDGAKESRLGCDEAKESKCTKAYWGWLVPRIQDDAAEEE